MLELNKRNDHLVFGLDIGTRSIVGSVGYLNNKSFHVIAHYVKEHDTRAMMDGQIHDIAKVSETIITVKKELEKQINTKLNEVCIAAAGRVLKTVTVHIDHELQQEQHVDNELVYSLDLLGVEKAYDIIREQNTDVKFYCVGYTVIKYYLNDYVITNLEGHKAKKISADVLATFLPEDVVDGLYTSVQNAGLTVSNLTLEPIAAINIAIPLKYRLLNIALVDVGAGTSDISITSDGSIIAYGMIPHAGDEITESLVSKYLVDFNTAEQIKRDSITKKFVSFKDIMGIRQKITKEEVIDVYEPIVKSMTHEIADKIIELNGGKSVNAVFVVGGGGKAIGFTDSLADALGLSKERVALRGEEVLHDVIFEQEDVKKDPLLVTPIGICLSFYDHKNNFIYVTVNNERIKLYDNDKLTVVDAAMQIGFPNDALFPRRGKELEFYVNNKRRMIRGKIGEAAVITINNEEANMNSKINKNDIINITESTFGEPASMLISQLPEYRESMKFVVNKKDVLCPKFVQVNNTLHSGNYEIKNGDQIEILDYYTLEQLMTFLDIDMDSKKILLNNKEAYKEDKVYENFCIDITQENDYDIEENDIQNIEPIESQYADDSQNLSNKIVGESNSKKSDLESEHQEENIHDICITVNETPVILKNKTKYIFVDILDFYPFDTKVAKGTQLITKINGSQCEFVSSIKDGDIAELYWR